MKLFKNGFTIAEMLICLGIISVVVAIMIPAVMSKKPNKNRSLFRKAYYNFERAVYELVNDESVFPSHKSDDYSEDNDQSTLFAYFLLEGEGLNPEVDANNEANKVRIAGNGDTLTARTKNRTNMFLCTQIAERMNTNGIVDCAHQKDTWQEKVPTSELVSITDSKSPHFRTNDGVMWARSSGTSICARELQADGTYKPRGKGVTECKHETVSSTNKDLKYPPANPSDYTCYELDVNGIERPNCRLCSDDPDRFRICVYFDGRIEVPQNDGKEAEYLKTNKIIE